MCDTQIYDDLSLSQEPDSVSDDTIKKLLNHFAASTYGAKTETAQSAEALNTCVRLFKKDYSLIMVNNGNGELSAHYPSQLPILEYENGNHILNITGQSSQRTTNTIYESIFDSQKLRDLFNKSRFARCRARFPVPVILFKGKYICRSATLSGGAEMYGRQGLDLFFGSESTTNNVDNEEIDDTCDTDTSIIDWHLYDKIRSQDIKLLKKFNVGTIVDFMVEKKKVKFGMYVTSSEKVDKENRYSDFNITSLPYPGCEFFKDFRDNNFNAEGLMFDWNQHCCDAPVSVPDNPFINHLRIEWSDYKTWDLIMMTQNYMKYLLKYLQDNSSGILIHCISGWDRTPLFVSLLRLSLWADGLAHTSLDEREILYLTIAYDWMLYGHNLHDRLEKGEEILFFCFYMLKYMASDEYSIAPGRHKLKKHSDKVEKEDTEKNKQQDGEAQCNADLLLENDLRGSNISLNSTCSTVSSKSQDPCTWYHLGDEPNGNSPNLNNWSDVRDIGFNTSSSPQARRTSPVTVPYSTRIRRTESSTTTSSILSNQSSNSTGSWQVVTGTGSLRSSDSHSSSDIPFSQTSMCTVVDGEEWLENGTFFAPCRKDRLQRVREIFYSTYFGTIGKTNVKYGPEGSFGAILGNIAGKVGFSSSK